jgi:hypothetical protein
VDYLQTAMQKEQISQEFVDLMAPRLAIGHTKEGALLVIEVQGHVAVAVFVRLKQTVFLFTR